MEIYNFLRLGNKAVKLISVKNKNAYEYEQSLHRIFNCVQFKQTNSRLLGKTLLQLGYVGLSLYAIHLYVADYPDLPVQLTFAFFCLFWAEIKIGISRNSDDRLSYVSEDLAGSGYTEWFSIPWPFVPMIPLITLIRAKPFFAMVLIIVIALIWSLFAM